jgi:hypothetical protein
MTMGKKRKRGTIRGAPPYPVPGHMFWSSRPPQPTNPRNVVVVEGFYHVPSIPPPTPRWLRSLNMDYTGNFDPSGLRTSGTGSASGMDSDNTAPSGTPVSHSSSGGHVGGGTPVSRTIVFFLIALGIVYLCWKTRRDSHEAEQEKLDLLTSNWEEIIQNFEDHQTQMVGTFIHVYIYRQRVVFIRHLLGIFAEIESCFVSRPVVLPSSLCLYHRLSNPSTL